MNINFHAPINDTGYGIASLNILKALVELEHNVSYFPIGNPSVSSQQDFNISSACFANANTFDPVAPCVKIWHQFDLASRIGRGKYFAYPFFELDTFNEKEKLHLSAPDEIIVSSSWAKDVIINNNIKNKIHIVPLGVDTSIFSAHNNSNRDKYTFLTIGKWEIRKSHELLPDIFRKAFPKETDVELIILASEHSFYSNKDEIQSWKNLYSTDARIKVIPGVETQYHIAQIIANSDCGLYISKAEGWNLELLETMAMNKPVIATNYSSHTEYCNKDNCYLVDIDEIEPAYDGKVFNGQGNWAKIDKKQIDQTINYMRYVYTNKINTNIEGLNTAKTYSWINSAKILSGCIS